MLYESQIPILMPATYKCLQQLVLDMANAHASIGKKTFFGGDKLAAAVRKFRVTFRECLFAMARERVLSRDNTTAEILDIFVGELVKFKEAYPNWPDAYSFAYEYFVARKQVALEDIDSWRL